MTGFDLTRHVGAPAAMTETARGLARVREPCRERAWNQTASVVAALRLTASAVVVTDGDNKVLAVDNADALKGHEGHHVAVTGEVKGDSIHVESVKML